MTAFGADFFMTGFATGFTTNFGAIGFDVTDFITDFAVAGFRTEVNLIVLLIAVSLSAFLDSVVWVLVINIVTV